MSLSEGAKAELRAVLRQLRAERERLVAPLDLQISALEAVLKGITASSAGRRVLQAAQNQLFDDSSAGEKEGVGFRQALMDVLSRGPLTGLLPSEIAARMAKMDIRTKGKGRILKRVYGELYKLHTADRPRVGREGGRYFLKEKPDRGSEEIDE